MTLKSYLCHSCKGELELVGTQTQSLGLQNSASVLKSDLPGGTWAIFSVCNSRQWWWMPCHAGLAVLHDRKLLGYGKALRLNVGVVQRENYWCAVGLVWQPAVVSANIFLIEVESVAVNSNDSRYCIKGLSSPTYFIQVWAWLCRSNLNRITLTYSNPTEPLGSPWKIWRSAFDQICCSQDSSKASTVLHFYLLGCMNRWSFNPEGIGQP